jgi:hypothetical protein|tara:strand:+ start:587 stop:1003 length:417 start_codon:yes stop_codon:yes gene_type:complete
MKDLEFPVHVREWPLKEEDITERACKSCGICCEIELKPNWKSPRQFEWLRAIAEGHDNITNTEKGIRIKCSHLRQTKHATDPHWECNIYEDRPQLCRDFNCVSWAKYSNDLTQYNRVLKKLGMIPTPSFSEELQGPDK